jgi:ATP-binding cassette subfamily B protein
MRRAPATALPGPEPTARHDWETLRTLIPYLWGEKARGGVGGCSRHAAQGAHLGGPRVVKQVKDARDNNPGV